MCVHARGGQHWIPYCLPLLLGTLVWRQVLFTEPRRVQGSDLHLLADWARWASQQAPGTHLSLPPQGLGSPTCATSPSFYMDAEDPTQVLMLTGQSPDPEPAPQPRVSLFPGMLHA